VILAVLPSTAPVRALAGLMVLVGLAGPLAMPPLTAVLLNSVPAHPGGGGRAVLLRPERAGGDGAAGL
jgi:MFS transporter, DHA2 family, methylenomycin A resistance protein